MVLSQSEHIELLWLAGRDSTAVSACYDNCYVLLMNVVVNIDTMYIEDWVDGREEKLDQKSSQRQVNQSVE